MNALPLARAAAIVALALLVAIAAVFAPARPIAAADTDDLLGTVIDAETKKPIVGALVSVWRDDTPADPDRPFRLEWPKQASRSVRTDSRGGFAFPKEPRAALRWFAVTATGYAPSAVPTSAPGVFTTIPLQRGVGQKVRFLRCGATGTEPAAGVEIIVLSFVQGVPVPLLAGRYTTAVDGSASIALGEQSGALLRGGGIATTRYPTRATSAPITLAPGGPVSGTITYPTGAPVADALVQVRGAWMEGLSARSDASGRFRIDGVPCGNPDIRLEVAARGCVPVKMPITGGASAVDIVVWPGARVRGRVVGAGGKPVANVYVKDFDPAEVREIQDADVDAMSRSATTAADGTFELDGVPGGIRTIEAREERGATWLGTIDIRPGAEVVDVAMELCAPVRGLDVKVIDPGGAPQPGLTLDGGERTTPVKTAADGTATVDVVPGYGTFTVRLRGGTLGKEQITIAVPATRAFDGRVTIRLCPAATLRVRAKGGDGKALPDNAVQWAVGPSDTGDVLASRGATGGFLKGPSLTVPAGQPFRLVAFHLAEGGVTARDCNLDAAKGGEIEVAFPPPGIVKARAPQGLPTDECGVFVTPVGEPDPLMGRIDTTALGTPTGEFTVAGLAPGEWLLAFVRPMPPLTVLAVRRETIGPSGGTIDLGDLPAPTVTLQGTVRSRGTPVPGAPLGLEIAGCREMPFTALPDGRFAVRIPAGLDAKITVRSPQHGWAAKSAAAPTVPLDFDLGPAATLVLRNALHCGDTPWPIQVRSGGASATASVAPRTGIAVVRGVAPGAVEIVVGEGKTARTIRVDAPAGKTTFVDLATAK